MTSSLCVPPYGHGGTARLAKLLFRLAAIEMPISQQQKGRRLTIETFDEPN